MEITLGQLDQTRDALEAIRQLTPEEHTLDALGPFWRLCNHSLDANPHCKPLTSIGYKNGMFYVNSDVGNLQGRLVVGGENADQVFVRLEGVYKVPRNASSYPVSNRPELASQFIAYAADANCDADRKQQVAEILNGNDEMLQQLSRCRALVVTDESVVAQLGPRRNWIHSEALLNLLDTEQAAVWERDFSGNDRTPRYTKVGTLAQFNAGEATPTPRTSTPTQLALTEQDLAKLF